MDYGDVNAISWCAWLVAELSEGPIAEHNRPMIPRWMLTTLVFGLPILVVTFGVVVGASALAQGLGDAAGARGLFWVAMVALVVLVVDVLLLVGALGIRALEDWNQEGR